MLSITKLQNLKAIHNTRNIRYLVVHDVINHKTTKFESNSQHVACAIDRCPDVINHKTTEFESNSQLRVLLRGFETCCYQSQNYKI